MASFHLFIVSSMDHEIYRMVQDKRRPLLKKYDIPYTVLLNATESPMENRSSPTFVPVLPDEILFPVGAMQPTMTIKFLNAVRQYFRSFTDFDDVPDYIIRFNATVYVYFPEMIKMLTTAPRTKILIGPAYGDAFVNGMVMIFSKDVMLNILNDPRIFNKDFMDKPDDVVLSELSKPYARWQSIMDNFVFPNSDNMDSRGLYRLDAIDPFENKKWYFRIRDMINSDRHMDIENWDLLVEYFDEDAREMYCKPVSRISTWTVLLVLTLLIMTLLIYLDGNKTRIMATRRKALEKGRR